MALNVIKAGYEVTAFDFNPVPLETIVAAGTVKE